MMVEGPTVAPPQPGSLNSALDRNIAALERRRRRELEGSGVQDKIASAISRFSGSMLFVYLHLGLYGLWIVANLGWLGLPRWDPSFVILAMIASVEAIFLSTFVLITQNRMSAAAEKRAELDLQISLLAEHELTRVVVLVSAIADHLGIETSEDLEELKRDVAPEAVLDAIDSSGSQAPSELEARENARPGPSVKG